MGAFAEAFVAYAQPLLDVAGGSDEKVDKALKVTQLCYNLALLPEGARDQELRTLQPSLNLSDEEFEEFRRAVFLPMMRRHQEMFPQLHGRGPIAPYNTPSPQGRPRAAARGETYPGTEPYAPCPCNSRRKYKFCCRSKSH